MRIFKLSSIFLTAALFMTACNRAPFSQSGNPDNYQLGRVEAGYGYDDDDTWARENLDLEAVGELLQRADNAEEFEYLLNNEQGVNNLDLNGDGYVDYISVREFDDRYDDQRGFSLYSMFGPEEIQEIATLLFFRDRYNDGYYPGARILLTGNEQIYGDNYYYETNWRDRDLSIVDWLFTNRDGYYRSPYYYNSYPEYYQPYPVVETNVYQTRIDQYYPAPVFIQTTQPAISEVRIVSPYREKSLTKVYSKLAKPTRAQVDFERSNPQFTEVVRANRERTRNFEAKTEKREKNNQNRFEKNNPNKFEREQRASFERPQQMREKPQKQERENFQPQNQPKAERQEQKSEQRQMRFEQRQQQRPERQQQMRFERQQPRFERPQQQQQQRFERPQQQQRMERPQPQQQMKPQKQENRGNGNGGGGNPNRGGGNGNGNGGGGGNKGGGGGGGKGKGKG